MTDVAHFYGEPVRHVRVIGVGDLTDRDFDREQRAYMEDPSAFWNRPDGDYLTDEPYVPVYRYYDVVRHLTLEIEMEDPSITLP